MAEESVEEDVEDTIAFCMKFLKSSASLLFQQQLLHNNLSIFLIYLKAYVMV